VCALALVAVWLLVRSRRERLARVLGEQADVEVTAAFLLAVCAAAVVASVFLPPPSPARGSAGRQLVVVLPLLGALASWGLRRFPRTGAALAALTLAATVWVLVALRVDDAAASLPPRGPLPWTAR
jgi:hypothetical protein